MSARTVDGRVRGRPFPSRGAQEALENPLELQGVPVLSGRDQQRHGPLGGLDGKVDCGG
ncbi:hypothetical protein KBZ21_00730 [Streptomyces sp. A73]|nr:hypothetical protein [Streptomyces sp. A73]